MLVVLGLNLKTTKGQLCRFGKQYSKVLAFFSVVLTIDVCANLKVLKVGLPWPLSTIAVRFDDRPLFAPMGLF